MVWYSIPTNVQMAYDMMPIIKNNIKPNTKEYFNENDCNFRLFLLIKYGNVNTAINTTGIT